MYKKAITIFIITFGIAFIALEVRPLTTKAYAFPLSEDKITAQEVQFLLEIPALGVSAPIVFESSTNYNKIYKSLERGVVHYSKTPKPGDTGVSIIVGHSSYPSWYKGSYGTVFDSLENLKNGDSIRIKNKDGSILNYKVTKSLIIPTEDYNDSELLDLETTNNSSLVLISCWPVGTAQQRIAVRADLI